MPPHDGPQADARWGQRSTTSRPSATPRPTPRSTSSSASCEREYLDDMRALRNDSVDVYARASDYVDQVISQIERLQRAGPTPSGRAARRATGRDRSSLGPF